MKFRDQIDLELREITPGEEMLQNILHGADTPHTLPKSGLLLCVALCILLLTVPVSARIYDTIRETTHITEENRELIDRISVASSEMVPAEGNGVAQPSTPAGRTDIAGAGALANGMDIAVAGAPADGMDIAKTGSMTDDPEKISEVTGGIIREIGDGALLPHTVTVIALSPAVGGDAWEIPELLTSNGFCTVFTKENSEGWELRAGESLRIQYSIGTTADTNPDSPQEQMQIGYIGNHVFHEGGVYRAEDFEYTLYAPEDGTYYLYNINASSGRILITEGEIR